jgi:hypothetical protein
VDEDKSYLSPDDEQDDEPIAEAEVHVSDEVIDDDADGDGDGASDEGDEPGMEEMKHRKPNSLKNMETLKFQGKFPTKN